MIVTEPKPILADWINHRLAEDLGFMPEYDPENMYIGWDHHGLQAVVEFSDYNGASIRMSVAGEGRRWLVRDYLWYCFYYPFVELGVKKIIGMVSSSNQDALRFDKHLGMVEEAVIKDACPKGDLHILTMTPQQCRFLAIRRPG